MVFYGINSFANQPGVPDSLDFERKRTGEVIPKEYKRNTVNMNTISGFVPE
jgi:hypothetical protein